MKMNRTIQMQMDRLLNRLKLWKLSETRGLASPSPESLSELDDYLTLCKLAAREDKYFKKFRSCESYRAILENVDGDAGEKLVKVIGDLGRSVADFSKLWHPEIGKPYKYHVANLGAVSPTEIRYSKVICELELFFGPLDGFSIAEIGVGFGGQGGQILETYPVDGYEFIDLEEPLQLVKRYLEKINAPGKKIFTNPLSVQGIKRDLVISNYAYSELNRELQELYLDKVISNSARGYVIYNHITPSHYKTMSAEEFSSRIKGSEILEEKPLSHPGNVLIVWGHESRAVN